MDTLRRVLLKLDDKGWVEENLETFLMTYRNTPHASLGDDLTPSDLFLGRRMGTQLDLMRFAKKPVKKNKRMEDTLGSNE